MDPVLERFGAAISDRYRLERELGRGGMATVFLADDIRHRRSVAIKVLDPRLAASLGPGRFLREIEIAARLVHPHILGLLDSGEAEGLLYYVMPMCLETRSGRVSLARGSCRSMPSFACCARFSMPSPTPTARGSSTVT
jgi:serine/threonine protein kinase